MSRAHPHFSHAFSSNVSTPRRASTVAVNSPPHRSSMANPLTRLQATDAKGYSSSASTPSCRVKGAKLVASYASVASTPASGSSTPGGSFIAMRSKGPRIVKVQPPRNSQGGSRAPFSSANVSGYSSVKHQARNDDKDRELEASSSNSTNYLSATSPGSSNAVSPQRESAGLSGHYTVPRAHFSAHLFRSIWGAPQPPWTYNEEPSASSQVSFRNTPPHPIGTPMTVWEWSR